MGNSANTKTVSDNVSQPKHARKYSQIFQRRTSILSSWKKTFCNNSDVASCESFNRLKKILTYYYKYIEGYSYSIPTAAVSAVSVGHHDTDTIGIPSNLLELTTNFSLPAPNAPAMKTVNSIKQILAKDLERKENEKQNKYHDQHQNDICGAAMYEYINNKFESGSYSNIYLLNDFSHCLQHHDNDKAFEYMYNNLISLICNECDMNSCLMLQRNYRNRMNIFGGVRDEIYLHKNEKEINIQQILDKIHCFYYHSYDLGLRLKLKLKPNIYEFLQSDLKENEIEEIDSSDKQILTLRHRLTKKNQNILKFNAESNRYFSDDLGGNNPRFYYWKYYQNKQECDDKYNVGYCYCDWYIPSPFASLKDELLNNCANICHFNDLYEKGMHYLQTDTVKKLLCNVSIWESSYNISLGTVINLQQILSILLYTSFQNYTSKFIKTFYYQNNTETKQSLMKRHCHFAHFGRLLRELCECYGVQTKNSKINIFYHGITDKCNMSIHNICLNIKAPFSTCLKQETIINYLSNCFDNDNDGYGLLLSLRGDLSGYSTYFDCHFLSDFVNEYELFFIGGLWPLMYENIVQINSGQSLKVYLYAMHVIHQMSNGVYYQLNLNQNIIKQIQNIVSKLLNHQLYRVYNDDNQKDAETCEDKKQGQEEEDSIDNEEEMAKRQKLITIARRQSIKTFKRYPFKPPPRTSPSSSTLPTLPINLQNNILNKKRESVSISDSNDDMKLNAVNIMSKKAKKILKYGKYEQIPRYIEDMLDRYCNNLSEIKLDYMRMNKAKSNSMPNYHGYKFCGDMFCLYKIEWFKLPIILKLFPNLKSIQIWGNIELTKKTLDYVLIILVTEINKIIKQYNINKNNLKKANKILKLKSIKIDEPQQDILTIRKAVKKYVHKFKKIKWNIYEDYDQLIITSLPIQYDQQGDDD